MGFAVVFPLEIIWWSALRSAGARASKGTVPGAMSDDEMEDYGFEYSDDEDEDEDLDADIENQYYNSKGLLESGSAQEALDGFASVIEMESEPGEWGFKALKQTVKLHFKLSNHEAMIQAVSYTHLTMPTN